MTTATVTSLVMPQTELKLPLRFEDRLSRASQIVRLAVVTPAAGCLIAAVIAGIVYWIDVLEVLQQSPMTLLQVAAGLCICAILFVMPALRLLYNFGRRRDVSIDNGIVTVRERAPLRDSVRQMRLADFDGIAHIVHTTSSGPCHKLVLIHREKALNVPIHAADRIAPHTIAHACAVLGLTEIAARDIDRRRARQPTSQLDASQPARHATAAPLAA